MFGMASTSQWNRFSRLTVATAWVAGSLTSCNKEAPPAPAPVVEPAAAAVAKKLQRADVAMFAALPDNFDSASNPGTDAKIALGQMLYHDKRLSKNQDVSCASCHEIDKGGADGKAFSPGHKGQLGGRNAPSVINAAGQFVQFWDGRAKDIEEQAGGPILNPVEMAMASPEAVLAVVKSMPEYIAAFQAAFPGEADAVTYGNLSKAIGAFERRLVAKSRWDKYLAGDDAALTDEEKTGALEFINAGCTACHNGVLVGGGMYQKAGLVKPWPNQKDVGRAAISKNDAEKLFFKVPSLRTATKTAPYFHDGSAATLEAAIKQMAEYQLGKQLSDAQVAAIAKWLGSMDGQIAPALLAVPKLPVSTETTPKPSGE